MTLNSLSPEPTTHWIDRHGKTWHHDGKGWRCQKGGGTFMWKNIPPGCFPWTPGPSVWLPQKEDAS